MRYNSATTRVFDVSVKVVPRPTNVIDSQPASARPIRRGSAVAVALAALAGSITSAVTWATGKADAAANPAISGLVGERPVDAAVQFADGEVRGISEVGNRIVAGGTFTKVGPAIRGAAGRVDLTTGDFAAGFPDVVGSVLTAIPDGGGGWWLGGNFTSVGGVARTHLAHVLSDQTVDPSFAPTLDLPVRALLVNNGALIVGGQFTTFNGTAAKGVVAVSASGSLLWNGNADGPVFTLASDGSSRVYVGGDFTAYGGQSAYKRLVAINGTTGALTTTFSAGTVNMAVNDIALDGAKLWLAGEFNKINNITRTRVAVIDATTGALDPLVPAGANLAVKTLALSGSTLYMGGDFTRIGTTNANGFAGISTVSGAMATTALAMTGTVHDITLDGAGAAYIGGNFVITPEKTQPRTLAKVTLSTLALTSVVPPPSLPLALARTPIEAFAVRTVAIAGGSLLVGGDFSDYGTISRSYLAAWDKTTGALDLAFDPQLNNVVRAVDGAANGTAVFVGGDFTTASGQTADRIVKLDMATGAPIAAFNVGVDAYVKEIVVHPDGNRVFVGGNFRFTGSTVTERFVGLNATTGAIIPGYQIDLTEPTNIVTEGGVRAMSLSPDGNRLAVVGNFRLVEGVARPLATILDVSNPTTATVTNWSTQLYDQPCAGGRIGWMRDVTYSPDGTRLFIVSSGHFYYRACDSVNAFDATATSDVSPLWSARPGDTIESVAATTDALYLGGHFRYLDWEHQVDGRFQLGALDPVNGRPLSWNPSSNGFRGVLVLEAEPSGLYMGGDNDAVGLVAHGRTARWNWPTGPWLRRATDRHQALAAGDTFNVTLTIKNPAAAALSITSFSDSLTGNVTSQGTCAPTTIAAGATFTCTYSQAIPAIADGTITTITTTATGSNGAPVTLSDRTMIRSVTAYPGEDMRTVVSPITVPYPSGNARWSITIWNDNELVPLTLNTLSSSLHGDLNGQGTCTTPQTIQPWGTYQCIYTGTVSGQIGTSIPNQIVNNHTINGVSAIDRHSTSVSIGRPADGGQVLMVVRSTTAVSDADIKIRDRIAQLGFTAVMIDDDIATAADATGKLAVFLSGSADPVLIGTKFAAVPVPVITALHTLYDEMGLTSAADQGTVTVSQLSVALASHPLVSPQNGAQTVVSTPRVMTWGIPASAAKVTLSVATTNGDRPSEFVYQPGALLADGSTAAACRIGFPAEKTSISKWAPQMYTWFDRAVRWSVYGCGNGIISTVAGRGSTQSDGDGGSATAAGLNDPYGLAINSSGGYYVAEYTGQKVRYVNPSGVISTFAGTGTAGSTGDGGQATSATLRNPTNVRLDPQGRVVIVDSGNHKIRRIDANGVITTIAGTGGAGYNGDNIAATSAKLNAPYDVAWDPSGNMYIADRTNHRIRRVSTTGIITTVAGTGVAGYNGDGIPATTARLQNPYGVAWGPDGLMIADFDNNRVRRVSSTGIIQTVAGTGTATAGGDGGPAILADLHKPVCIMIRPAGGYYICDYNNNRVRYVDADGVISTVAGVGTAGYGGDGDLALYALGNRFAAAGATPSGDLLVVDRFNKRVRVIVNRA